MRGSELLRLVWMNMVQNKFKTLMTSIGIIVGTATIVIVIAIGRGGQADVAEQFKNLNAGAIDISYQGEGANQSKGDNASQGTTAGQESGGFAMPGGGSGGSFAMPGGGSGDSIVMPGGSAGGEITYERPEDDFSGRGSGDSSDGERSDGSGRKNRGEADGEMKFFFEFGGSDMEERMNQEKVTLTEEDVEDITLFVGGISAATISYTTRADVDGGELEEAATYTIAGVKENYAEISNLELYTGDFITDSNDESKEKVCVLGASVATEIFGSAIDAYGSILYIDNRPYVVNGILQAMGTVASGISPDDAVLVPYETGIKYLVGTEVNPTVTVLAEDVDNVEQVITDVGNLLAESYPNTTFTYEDAGSKMEAASASNKILTMLLIAMAAIVFVVGGIGIMNVLFVSVKERTNEIGILKAIGCSKGNIMTEFLLEAAAISFVGGVLGLGISIAVTPIVEYLGVRAELSGTAFVIALLFAVGTGTIFGFYPAWKASKLVPIEALSAE